MAIDHDHGPESPNIDHPRSTGQPHSAAEWDARYGSAERVWTANVNPALLVEAADLAPGAALDVGSGEGADARWLAARGWRVTALDISHVALERARTIDPLAGDAAPINWVRADLTVDDVPGGTGVGNGNQYDLITLHYFPVLKSGLARPGEAIVDALVGAVAPGGTLLVVAHALEGVRAHGFNPDDYIQPADFRARISGGDIGGWAIDTDEVRPRGIAAGGGHHVDDIVLRAHRPLS